jgi:hypothetical protein
LVYNALIFVDDADDEGYRGIDQKKKRNDDVVHLVVVSLNMAIFESACTVASLCLEKVSKSSEHDGRKNDDDRIGVPRTAANDEGDTCL